MCVNVNVCIYVAYSKVVQHFHHIHQAMKANSISALSFHCPGHFSIHFIVSKRNIFYFFSSFSLFFSLFYSFLWSILGFSFHFLWPYHSLRLLFFFLHSTKTHNGGTMDFSFHIVFCIFLFTLKRFLSILHTIFSAFCSICISIFEHIYI